ncbi:hypothetical protein Raf01_38650 [Rugosimonospora africana]|uniref:Uncharacterized protein n=1 Tax=Rugosimonospora africana TaxID=556532 RepID=A0A8J3QRR9_9ACTN|nr:hypothetical protein Raf01_38650 [Rugosimonospora africana]
MACVAVTESAAAGRSPATVSTAQTSNAAAAAPPERRATGRGRRVAPDAPGQTGRSLVSLVDTLPSFRTLAAEAPCRVQTSDVCTISRPYCGDNLAQGSGCDEWDGLKQRQT